MRKLAGLAVAFLFLIVGGGETVGGSKITRNLLDPFRKRLPYPSLKISLPMESLQSGRRIPLNHEKG